MNNTIIQEVFNEKEAATYLRISPKTLQKWRCVGGAPEYRLVGGRSVATEEINKLNISFFGSLIGVPGEIRTHDPQIRNGAKASSIDYYLVLLSEVMQCLLPLLNKIQYSQS